MRAVSIYVLFSVTFLPITAGLSAVSLGMACPVAALGLLGCPGYFDGLEEHLYLYTYNASLRFVPDSLPYTLPISCPIPEWIQLGCTGRPDQPHRPQ